VELTALPQICSRFKGAASRWRRNGRVEARGRREIGERRDGEEREVVDFVHISESLKTVQKPQNNQYKKLSCRQQTA